MKNNEKVALAAVTENGYALEFVSEKLRDNEKVVMVAVSKHGLNLEFASD